MESALGWSEILVLGVLAALLLDAQELKKLWQAARRLRTLFHRLRYDLEDALQGTGEAMDKPTHDLRQRARLAVQSLSTEHRLRQSAELVEQLRALPELHEAPFIAAFHPDSREPDITPWLREVAAEGRLLLPRVLPDRQMEFVLVRDLDLDLCTGAYGLREPRPELPASTLAPSAFLVPGLVFGPRGERMGHGAGYYDRFLARYPDALRLGIAFGVQVLENPIPQAPHDIAMHRVLRSMVN